MYIISLFRSISSINILLTAINGTKEACKQLTLFFNDSMDKELLRKGA